MVDDVKLNQVLMKQVLKRIDIDCDIASDGQEAIQRMQQQRYDLVLMDLHMPRLDGLSSVKLTRSGEAEVIDATVPILGLTADAFQEVHDNMLAKGFTDTLRKPIDLDQVYAKITSLLADVA